MSAGFSPSPSDVEADFDIRVAHFYCKCQWSDGVFPDVPAMALCGYVQRTPFKRRCGPGCMCGVVGCPLCRIEPACPACGHRTRRS